VNEQICAVREREDYLGKAGHREIALLQEQFSKQQHLYWLRKRACFDLIEVFADLHQEDSDTLKARVGLEEDDF